MNGKNGLACITPLSALKGDKIVIRPLPGLPVVRDLIVDMTQFYDNYAKVKPFLIADDALPLQERTCNPQKNGRIWMVCTSVLCALAVPLPALHSGGIRINLSDLQVCWLLIVG